MRTSRGPLSTTDARRAVVVEVGVEDHLALVGQGERRGAGLQARRGADVLRRHRHQDAGLVEVGEPLLGAADRLTVRSRSRRRPSRARCRAARATTTTSKSVWPRGPTADGGGGSRRVHVHDDVPRDPWVERHDRPAPRRTASPRPPGTSSCRTATRRASWPGPLNVPSRVLTARSGTRCRRRAPRRSSCGAARRRRCRRSGARRSAGRPSRCSSPRATRRTRARGSRRARTRGRCRPCPRDPRRRSCPPRRRSRPRTGTGCRWCGSRRCRRTSWTRSGRARCCPRRRPASDGNEPPPLELRVTVSVAAWS